MSSQTSTLTLWLQPKRRSIAQKFSRRKKGKVNAQRKASLTDLQKVRPTENVVRFMAKGRISTGLAGATRSLGAGSLV